MWKPFFGLFGLCWAFIYLNYGLQNLNTAFFMAFVTFFNGLSGLGWSRLVSGRHPQNRDCQKGTDTGIADTGPSVPVSLISRLVSDRHR